MKNRLRWPSLALASAKHVSSALAASGAAFAILTGDMFFASFAGIFTALALFFAIVQSGLIARRSWARRAAIIYSCLYLPSLTFPLAALSLHGLLHPDMKEEFRAPRAFRIDIHRATVAVAAFVFCAILATSLTARQLRKERVKPHVSYVGATARGQVN